MSTRVVVAFGSNQGDREETLRAAVREISALEGVAVTTVSGLVESHAVKLAGVDENAPSYVNGVLVATTSLGLDDFLTELQRIELEHGRVRLERWGDRTLDLDIVAAFAADGTAIQESTERLTVPHPRAWERAFVLAPWAQVDAQAEIAGHGRVADLLAPIASAVWQSDAAAPFDGSVR
ncbi:MAG: 2-amino-4-hydroxy-6-hydroxymethyldihydropteridine diphosphokinase [Lacisediminihabitans sp.]